MAKPSSGTGKGGKSFQDRELAARVRTKTLNDLLLVLSDDKKSLAKVAKWSDYKKRVLEKLSGSILPRLNEHSGADGAPLKIAFDPSFKDVAA